MITILKLFLTFAKIGFIGFGGGLAILPLIYQGIAGFSPITPEEFANLVGISQATPGPIAVNAATYVGYLTSGIPGALAATLGVAVPSFIMVSLAVRFLTKYEDTALVKGAFSGIRPATIGMLASALVFVAQSAVFYGGTHLDLSAAALAVLTFILAAKTKIGPIGIILMMGAIGAGLCFI